MTWRGSHGAKREGDEARVRERNAPWGVLGIAIWLRARAMARSAMAMMLGCGEETLLGEFWELPYGLARGPWRKEGWR